MLSSTLWYVQIPFVMVSLGCASFISYSIQKHLRSAFPYSLIISLALSDVGVSLSQLFFHPLCRTQGFFITFFSTASLLWTMVIALNIYIALALRHPDPGSLLSRYQAGVWGSSAFLAVLFLPRYGPEPAGYCAVVVGTFYDTIVILVIMAQIALLGRTVQLVDSSAVDRRFHTRLAVYGGATLLTRLWAPLVHSYDSTFYVVMQMLALSSQGTINALVYGWNQQVQALYGIRDDNDLLMTLGEFSLNLSDFGMGEEEGVTYDQNLLDHDFENEADEQL